MKSKQMEMVEVEGRMIPRSKVGFFLREAETKAGKKVLVGSGGAVYDRDPNVAGGKTLVRLDKKKLSKADRKALKRAKFKGGAPLFDASGYDRRLLDLALAKGWVMPGSDTFPAAAWNGYWSAMELSEKDPSLGRPIPPHRSGGGLK